MLNTLLLGWSSAAPASAPVTISSDTTIDTTINDNIHVVGTAHVTIVAGASIGGNVIALNSSTVTVTGGSISGGLRAFDTSTVTVSGGSIASLVAADSGTVNVTGGSIGQVVSRLSSTINISGGSIYDRIQAQNRSTIHLFGCNLLPSHRMLGPSGLTSNSLTGTLQDGTVLNRLVESYAGGSFQLHETSCRLPMDADRVFPADGTCLLAALERALAGLAGENPTAARAAIVASLRRVEALIDAEALEAGDGRRPRETAHALLAGLPG
jgi:hypothetical protein